MMKNPLRPRLLDLERRAVIDALTLTRGEVRAAAEHLDIPERTLWYRMKCKLNINPDEFR